MVDIVKQPPDGEWTYKWTCGEDGCQAELRAKVADIRVGTFGGTYCENGDRKYYVVCPCCGTNHIIPDKKVPPKAMSAAAAHNVRLE